jgi:aminoglycoside/choline kinase family phosphotransferase
MPEPKGRLFNFLKTRGRGPQCEELSPDASTRAYFRVPWDAGSAVACVYPEAFDPAVGTYVDVSSLFLSASLPVADIIDYDPELAIEVQEALGDRILRDEITIADASRKEELLHEAIRCIARIQAATPLAYERDSIAFRLKFDTEKLSWELDYFKTHYFTTLRDRPLPIADDRLLDEEFRELSSELETYAKVLCHRDFHAANLMLDREGRMRIIDHQDARIGSVTYDLVSLLLDRITDLPDGEWLREKKDHFNTVREACDLPPLPSVEFDREFDLQTIQRCLKAAGTFSFQSATRGKFHFIPFIKPMFRAALAAIERIDRFPTLRRILEVQINEN